MPLASLAVGAGTSIIGGILGANAASTAAAQEAKAAQTAANYAQQTGGASLAAQTGATQQAKQYAQPYTGLGAQGAGSLAQMLAPGGFLSQNWTGQFQAPTAAQAQAYPGYQFALQQGQQAINRSAAARGGLLSSGTLKSLDQYSQGLADQTYQQTYNNAWNQYLNNQNTFYQNQMNQYNRLMGITGVGQQTTADLNRMLQAGAENQARVNLAMSGQYGQDITNVGVAQAAGTMGQANALSNMLSGIGGAAAQGFGLRSQTGGWTNWSMPPAAPTSSPGTGATWSDMGNWMGEGGGASGLYGTVD